MKNDTRVRITFSLKPETFRWLEGRRKKTGQSRSAVVEDLLREWLKEQEKADLEAEVRAYYAAAEPKEEKQLRKALYKAGKRAMAASEFADEDFSAWEPPAAKRKAR